MDHSNYWLQNAAQRVNEVIFAGWKGGGGGKGECCLYDLQGMGCREREGGGGGEGERESGRVIE